MATARAGGGRSRAVGSSQQGGFSGMLHSNSASSSHTQLVELKQRVLAALTKLGDRDTQRHAVEELHRMVEGLAPEGVPIFLVCLYDSDGLQKSFSRKESVRLFGTMAIVHGDLLSPHLSKIVINIVRRFKDPDTGVREMCAEAMGSLAAHVLLPGQTGVGGGSSSAAAAAAASASASAAGSDAGSSGIAAALGTAGSSGGGSSPAEGPAPTVCTPKGESSRVGVSLTPASGSHSAMGVFFRPLFDALNEQNKNVQVTAALCLSKVVQNMKVPLGSGFTRLCPRISKCLANPNFLAKGPLLTALGNLVEAAGPSILPALSSAMPHVVEALDSMDWSTRKAAVEALTQIASSLGTSLSDHKNSVLDGLEGCRFDKVKPVRDNVVEALQLWKEVPSPPVPEGSTSTVDADGRRCSGASEASNSNVSTSQIDSRTPTREVSTTSRQRSIGSPLPSPGASPAAKSPRAGSRVGSSSKPPWSSDRKKAPVRQENPDFFKSRGSTEWHVEVAVPTLKRPPTLQGRESRRQEESNDAMLDRNAVFQEKRESVQSRLACGESSEGVRREERLLGDNVQEVEVQESCKAEVKEAENRGVASNGRCEGREADVRISYEDGRDREPEAEDGDAMRVLSVTRERGRWRLGEQSRGAMEEVERHLSSGRESPAPKDVGIVHNETVSDSRMEDLTRRGDTPLSVVREFRALSLSDVPDSSGQDSPLGDTVVGSVPMSMTGGWPPARPSRRRSLSWGSHIPVPQDVLAGDLEGAMEELRGAELRAIRRQLIRLEDHQQRMMEMLQDFIRSSQDTLNGVEGRMRALERGADGMARMVSTSNRLRASNGGGPLVMMGYGEEVVRHSGGGAQYWGGGSDGSVNESMEGVKWRSSVMGDAATAHVREESNPGQGSRDVGAEQDDRQLLRDHPSVVVNGHLSSSVSGPPSLLPPRERSMPGSDPANGGGVGGSAYLDTGNYENGHSHQPAQQRVWGSVNCSGSVSSSVIGTVDSTSSGGMGWHRNSQIDVLDAEKIDELYACSVRVADEIELVRLMGKTGPVLTKLMPDTAEEVVGQLLKMLPKKACLETAIPWMGQLLELSPDTLPRRLQMEVLSALRELASDPSVLVGSDMIARLVAQLSIHWAPNML